MKELFYKGNFGIERETLRVDNKGKLAQTPHPFGDDPLITRDFCENQLELITPVCPSLREALKELEKLDAAVNSTLSKQGEHIWMYSNPPHFNNENDIPVAKFSGKYTGKRLYRENLQRRYGKRLMLFSGIHFNFSFSDEYLRKICNCTDFRTFKDEFYLRLYKQLSIYSWLPLLLTAASPVYDLSLYNDGENGAVTSNYASIRNGDQGYWNEFEPILDHSDLSSFVDSIKNYVDKGILFSASELYLPVRLKPVGVNSIDNFKNGVSHIELRMFDLNPTKKLGIDETDLVFSHLLIMYLSKKEDFIYTKQMQQEAIRNHKNAALLDLKNIKIDGIPIISRAKQIIKDMKTFYKDDINAQSVLDYEYMKLDDRLCFQVKADEIYRQEGDIDVRAARVLSG